MQFLLAAAKTTEKAAEKAAEKTGFTFQVTPDPGRAPGAAGIQIGVNVIAAYALEAALAGFLLGGAIWAIGGRIANDHAATGGKIGMSISVGVAFLVGGAAAILQFAYGLGK
jgi:hypothetical protein